LHYVTVIFHRFVVILIGESGVGKSSIVQRYCDDSFSNLSTTIGVDVVIKKLFNDTNNNFIEVRLIMYLLFECTTYPIRTYYKLRVIYTVKV